MGKVKLMKHIFRFVFIFIAVAAYQHLTLQWCYAPPPPPFGPGTPIENSLLHVITVAGVIGYGAWRMKK